MSDGFASIAGLLAPLLTDPGAILDLTFEVELLPALLVAVPILAAAVPIVLGLRFDRTGWSVALLTSLGLFAGTIAIAREVYATGGYTQVIHEVGGYPAPYGIELVADEFSTIIALLVTGSAVGVLAYTRVGGPRGSTFYAAYLLLTGGLLGLSFTGDAFNMFVFLEIVGLATYGLIARGDSAESAVAALKYLVLGTLGASLYLLGVGLLFMATGHLNMEFINSELYDGALVENETLVRASFAFVFVGFAIKVAQWPLHTWQPDAYQRAPDGITPLIAALVSTVSAYALGRILFTVYGVEFVTATPYVQEIILTVGIASVMAGSILAVTQTDVKRMLAYSSVSQFGLIVAAYGLATPLALVGAIVHLVGHGLMKAGLFLGAGVVAAGYGARRVREFAGLAEHRPVAAASIAVLAISLVGIPPSIGFIGKWYIAVGAIQAEAWTVAAVIFLSTMLTLLYVARLLETMYFTPASARSSGHAVTGESGHGDAVATDGGEEANESFGDRRSADSSRRRRVSVGMLAIVAVFAVLTVGLGFAGDVLYEAIEPFAEEVFDDG
ncbi:monovalent cation/H+ antiporter subunit D family protein [Halovivax gelatinilyticus]|uniref:monovalent cation/H+ antiporter subunit D family protein n=1 Tax=Halovivax gelatinilyticus TaxID=2961597 RepID=UPI0020CA994E|nr:monovalent cation/H+ antiporter subunit D family protein [Halovivax gelatinilyticus]